jgi:septum formation protein
MAPEATGGPCRFDRTGPIRHAGGVTRLVLASASPARLGVLRAGGLAPEVIVSGVDEDDVTGSTDQVALVLAQRKAAAVAEALDGPALVLGCDTVLDVDGHTRGKPADLDEARAWWRSVAGRAAVLHTGHCVIDTAAGAMASGVASTVVHYGTPTDAEIEAYLATGEPLAVAGGFTIDGYAAPFVDRLEGDHGTVLGLSLPLLRRLLTELGHQITDLWTQP